MQSSWCYSPCIQDVTARCISMHAHAQTSREVQNDGGELRSRTCRTFFAPGMISTRSSPVSRQLRIHRSVSEPFFRRSHPSGGGAPQGWPVCVSVCVSVYNKKYFRSSALTPFRDLRFITWPRKLCSATLTLSRAFEMASRARTQDVSGTRDLGSVSQKSS